MHTSRLRLVLLLTLLAASLAACTPPLLPGNGEGGVPNTPVGSVPATPAATVVNPSPPPGSTLPALHITTATGQNVVLYVEVASTPAQHERGLMGRTSLPPDAGMLFDFGQSVQIPFWMRNTLIPLSIAWFTQDGLIVDMAEMAAQSDTLHQPKARHWYALEANAGFFTAHGVAIGDHVTWPPK